MSSSQKCIQIACVRHYIHVLPTIFFFCHRTSIDKAPRPSISNVIWILSSVTVCQLNQLFSNSEAAMLFTQVFWFCSWHSSHIYEGSWTIWLHFVLKTFIASSILPWNAHLEKDFNNPCDCPFLKLDKKMRQEIYLTSGEREGEVVNLKCAASKGVHHVTAAEVFVEILAIYCTNSKKSRSIT